LVGWSLSTVQYIQSCYSAVDCWPEVWAGHQESLMALLSVNQEAFVRDVVGWLASAFSHPDRGVGTQSNYS